MCEIYIPCLEQQQQATDSTRNRYYIIKFKINKLNYNSEHEHAYSVQRKI